jgi:anthranilate synthase component 1
MLHPSYDRFIELSKCHGRVPVYREIAGDLVTPIGLLANFSDERHLFLLESANCDKSFSRYTFFGIRPRSVVSFRNGTMTIESGDGALSRIEGNPVEHLEGLLSREQSSAIHAMGNFCGGYVGFIGYDIANYMGVLRKPVREDRENLVMALFQVDDFYVFDNKMGRFYAAHSATIGDDPDEAYRRAGERTMEMAAEILSIRNRVFPPSAAPAPEQDFELESFMNAVRGLKDEIVRGECIQAVLSNKYEIPARVNPVNLYRLLRNINPSPYMFYLKTGEEVLCGTSPEVHLKVEGETATLKPIAGTYRLEGSDPEETCRRLLEDEKERAEHLMLLDLARNDLYTGCESDSVAVVSSFEPEVYSHLVHIVSEVRGRIRDDVTPLRLFCNTFPAWTVSGAPKVRAMELIDEYERSPRGFYAGCAGYFAYSGDIDTCIIIRSAMVKPDRVILRAGAGIVYDSDPEKEYREVGNKLGAIFDAMTRMGTLENRNVFIDR